MTQERVKEIAKEVATQVGADQGKETVIELALLSVMYRMSRQLEDKCFELIRHDVSLKHPVNSLKQMALILGDIKTKAMARIKGGPDAA